MDIVAPMFVPVRDSMGPHLLQIRLIMRRLSWTPSGARRAELARWHMYLVEDDVSA